jgi:hypothetical protein
MTDGHSIFKMDTGAVEATMASPRRAGTMASQLAFICDGRHLVCGSDHGRVYVFDIHQRICRDVLYHAQHGHVAYITVSAEALCHMTLTIFNYRHVRYPGKHVLLVLFTASQMRTRISSHSTSLNHRGDVLGVQPCGLGEFVGLGSSPLACRLHAAYGLFFM